MQTRKARVLGLLIGGPTGAVVAHVLSYGSPTTILGTSPAVVGFLLGAAIGYWAGGYLSSSK